MSPSLPRVAGAPAAGVPPSGPRAGTAAAIPPPEGPARRSTGEALASWLAARAKALDEFGGPARGTLLVPAAWALVALFAAADFAMGSEITLRFLYCVPLVLIVAARGTRPAILMALVCDACWIVGDVVAGARYSSLLAPLSNVVITLGVYLIVIWLLGVIWFMSAALWVIDLPTAPYQCPHCGAAEKLSRTFFSFPQPSGLIDDDGPFLGTWPAIALIGYSVGARLALKRRRADA